MSGCAANFSHLKLATHHSSTELALSSLHKKESAQINLLVTQILSLGEFACNYDNFKDALEHIFSDLSICGFHVEPPSLSLRLGPSKNTSDAYEITISANGTEELDGLTFQIQAATCQEPPSLSPKRPLYIYYFLNGILTFSLNLVAKPNHPKWTKPVFCVKVPTHLTPFTTLANLSEFAIAPINFSISNFSVEGSESSHFLVDETDKNSSFKTK
ncbi:hypothetical protein EGR_09259 [Echinococcus granulosus]|uniref:Uncharacterized protein n=1 Tax=Echinococcus granulosus TaxID=6210 RepID=W6UBU1_ECHGR|nr:hypothetical protein EGR_09259 [Echinococcus granulosus]EUB55902.1 hypothetical protein EGR_09259 [Echinococcus granulosus]